MNLKRRTSMLSLPANRLVATVMIVRRKGGLFEDKQWLLCPELSSQCRRHHARREQTPVGASGSAIVTGLPCAQRHWPSPRRIDQEDCHALASVVCIDSPWKKW